MENYIKQNKLAVFLVLSAILTGTAIGAFSQIRLEETDASSLIFAVKNNIENTKIFTAFLTSLKNEFLRFFVIAFCGSTMLGTPVCVACLGMIGYSLGFSSCFLMQRFGLLGFLGVLLGIIPHYSILLPAYSFLGISSINLSNEMLFERKKVKNSFNNYLKKIILFAVIIFFAILVESFISCLFLKKILMIK